MPTSSAKRPRVKRQVQTGSGPLVVEDDGVLVRARGVRYGTARRFCAPRPVPKWTEPRDAVDRGPACPQLSSRLEFVTGPVIDGLVQSEDCQVLSVTAPSGADKLPVMVWFHGGAYMSGGGESTKYDPDALVAEGQVVVVSVTYRLGVFGFLTPSNVGDDNLGLRDQLLALQWVHDNIAAFGGDPDRVTLFGQSAGGDSVFSILLCEQADGMYSRAIVQSAPLGLRDGRDAMTAAMRSAVTESLGGTDPLDADVHQLLAAQRAAAATAQRFGAIGSLPFASILGADPLPAPALVEGRLSHAARTVELLVGYTKSDAAPFVWLQPRSERLRRMGPPGAMANSAVSSVATRRLFASPVHRLARTWRRHGGEVACYRFDWAPPGAPLGACHCMELALLFGADWAGAPMLCGAAVDHDLAQQLRRDWSGFARDGAAALPSRRLRYD